MVQNISQISTLWVGRNSVQTERRQTDSSWHKANV